MQQFSRTKPYSIDRRRLTEAFFSRELLKYFNEFNPTTEEKSNFICKVFAALIYQNSPCLVPGTTLK
jgi:hypothetical protein